MNPTRSRLLIYLRDLVRGPYNASGLWLLRLRLAWPFWLARARGQTAPAAPPPICASPAGPRRPPARGDRGAARGDRGAARDRWQLIYPAMRVAPPQARTLAGARPPWHLHRYQATRCAPAYVVGLANAQYHAPDHDIFNSGGCLLPVLSFYGPENRLAESREYARRFARGLPPAQDWPGVTAVLAGHHADWNYFHWMLQCLPRFELLRLAGVTFDQVDRYLLQPAHFPFQSETLARLEVPPHKIVTSGPDTHFRAEFLWAASSLRLTGHINPWAADFLRRTFLPPAGVSARGSERIFISRSDAHLRQMVNEPEIMARLEQLGFRVVVPGQLTVVEQASLFAGAQVIVAPHGAGLANLVFARTGARVLELHSPTRRATMYWEMASARRLDYYYLIGEDASSASDAQAFRLPLAGLNALLEMAGVR